MNAPGEVKVAWAAPSPVRLMMPSLTTLAAVRTLVAERVPSLGPIWMVPSLVSVPPIVSDDPPSRESRS